MTPEDEDSSTVSCEVVLVNDGGELKQHLSVVREQGEQLLVVSEGGARLRSWPLHAARLLPDHPIGGLTLEVGNETLKWARADVSAARRLSRAAAREAAAPSEAALAALLHDAAPLDADAEAWVRRLAERLARLDALNVQGMLAAATEGGGAGARLASRLDAGANCGAQLAARLSRLDALMRGAGDAGHARSGAARADSNARALLHELDEVYAWLDAPALRQLDAAPALSLAAGEGRARALDAARALRSALRAQDACPPHRRRLAAVRDRLRRLQRARDALAASIARHLNNLLIHLGNEAAGGTRHHAELAPYAPFMLWLKEMDERSYEALWRLYASTWARVHERDVRAAADAARAALPPHAAHPTEPAPAPADRVDELFDSVLTLVENLCNAEQDFCTQFFHLDVDVKSDGDGERSEKSDRSEEGVAGAGGGSAAGGGGRRGGAECRRMLQALFPALEPELVALVAHVDQHDAYGAMRALACAGRRVLWEGTSGVEPGGGGRWARAALAAAAVAAKRCADRSVAARIDAMPLAVKQAARRPKCGVLSFVSQFSELSAECERIFAGGRRADLDRWYAALADGMLRAVAGAAHPRTPRAVLLLENYHALQAALAALGARRVSALDAARRAARARYADALRLCVTHYLPRPLDKLTHFFEGVSEVVASGVREDEVCYRAAFSKHELKRLLALYPAHEVRRSLHRLYRAVERELSEAAGLLQVLWRALQEEFLAHHRNLQSRLAACYAGSGLALPLSTQDILDAFSDIARDN